MDTTVLSTEVSVVIARVQGVNGTRTIVIGVRRQILVVCVHVTEVGRVTKVLWN